jgi:hypothetical protein
MKILPALTKMQKHGIWFSLLYLLISCKSAPQIPDPVLMSAFPLESGASIYLYADAKKARPVIEMIPIAELKNKQALQMLDKTVFLTAALFPQESGRRFQLAAWGNYPNSFANMALGTNKNWKKHNSEAGAYWHSSEDKLSIAFSSKQAFTASWQSNTPSSPVTFSSGIELPEGFNEFRKGAPLSCWFEEPGSALDRVLDNKENPFKIPARRMFLNLIPEGEENESKLFNAVIRMQFSSATQARGIAALFTIARNFTFTSNSALAGVFFANPPELNGTYMDIKTGNLSEKEISLLFNLFLLQ